MAVIPTAAAAFAGVNTKTWIVTAAAGVDVGDVVIPHGFGAIPQDVVVSDTTATATVLGNPWGVHTIDATNITVRKAVATAEARTGLVVARLPHSIEG